MNSTSVPASSPTCTGRPVQIKAGDTCDSLAAAHNISTWQLLAENHLVGGCAHFLSNGSLCVTGSCQTHKVAPNETCLSIANRYSITVTQLRTWNPNLNAVCSNLNLTIGHQICVSDPWNFTSPINTYGGSPTSATTDAPRPTNMAPGTNTHCGRFYEVKGMISVSGVEVFSDINAKC